MAVIETVFRQDLKNPVQVRQLSGCLYYGDSNANIISVEVFDNGEPVEFTESDAIFGYVLREDNYTVPINGEISETVSNKVSILLPASAYDVIGRVSIVLKVGATTLGACTTYVYRTTTENVIDPGSVVPNISQLEDKISACVSATTNANSAAGLANEMATEASRVNIALSTDDDVITITITDRNGTETTATLTDFQVATTTETQAIIDEYAG